MHLLKIEQSGDLYASGEAVDLGQTPGRIAILTAADSEISLLAEAARTSGLKAGDLRLANLLSLSHPYSIDLYIENTLAKADMIMVRLLGGTAYWSYGVEQLSLLAREKKIPLPSYLVTVALTLNWNAFLLCLRGCWHALQRILIKAASAMHRHC